MRIAFIAVFAVLLLPLIALSQKAATASSVCTQDEAVGHHAVLAVCTRHQGKSKSRTWLDLRVYGDGRAENEPEGDAGSPVLKKFRITSRELREILKLGRTADFQKAEESYPAFKRKMDASSLTTVTFRDGKRTKRIVLANFYADDPENTKHYPPSLIKLIKLADKIRERNTTTSDKDQAT